MAGAKEPKRLRPRLKVSVEKGLMTRDDDSINGFASDMKNVSIVGGTVEQRKGSKMLMPNRNVQREWMLYGGGLKEIDIAGSRFLLGIDQKGNIVAINETFPECEFLVYSFMESNKAVAVAFDRGDSFWLLNAVRYIYLVNNHNDVLRIDKKGTLEWWYEGKTFIEGSGSGGTNYRYRTIAGNPDPMAHSGEIGQLLLDVVDATHAEIEDIYVIDNLNQDTPPLRGQVRVAAVNNAGNLGPWSREIVLPDYKSCFFSLLPAINVSNENIIQQTYQDIVASTDPAGTALYVGYFDGARTMSSSFLSNGQTSNSTTAVIASDIGPTISTLKDDIYIFFKNAPAYLPQFMRIDSLQILRPVRNPADPTKVALILFDSPADFVVEAIEDVTDEFTKYISDVSDGGAYAHGAAFKSDALTISPVGPTTKIFKLRSKTLSSIVEASILTDKYIADNVDINDSAILAQFVASVTLTTNVNLTYENPTGNYIAYQHLGFDLWQRKGAMTIYYNDLLFSTDDMGLYLGSRFDDVDILSKSTYVSPYSGKRFAIWNDNEVLRKSQRAFYKNGSILYEYLYDTALREKTPFEMINVPVMSTDYISLEKYQTGIPKKEFLLKNIEAIDINNGFVYAYDGNRIYVSDERMVPDNFLELNETVEHIVKFFDGALVFTTDNAFRVNSNAERFFVPGGAGAKAVLAFEGAVCAIHKDNSIAIYQIYYRENGSPEVRVTPIHEAIREIGWSGSPKMAYCNDTIYIADGNQILGFYEGGWKKHIEFDHEITNITSYKNELVVQFGEDGTLIDIWGIDFALTSPIRLF